MAEWQSLASLAKSCAALPKEAFAERYAGPFLLELNPEAGEPVAGGETRVFSATDVPPGLGPSLEKSQIFYMGELEGLALGRSDSCEIVCQDSTISDLHCRFDSFGSIWAIKDEASRNGTFVNGRKLNSNEQSPLKFGTKIMSGSAQFLFLSSEDTYDLVQDMSREPRIRPRSLGKYRSEFRELGEADKVQEGFPGPFLVVQAPSGRNAGAKSRTVDNNTIALSEEELKKSINKSVTDAIFDLSKHNLVRIGRATVTQIHLPLGAVSNLHAALVRKDDGTWNVQDLGAKNGTYVWGDRLPPQGCRTLESGTEIMLGNIKSIFFYTEDLLTYATHRDTLV
jgi:pSer/pThr/pTyr-binding forkhead associated (FHA) protein